MFVIVTTPTYLYLHIPVATISFIELHVRLQLASIQVQLLFEVNFVNADIPLEYVFK